MNAAGHLTPRADAPPLNVGLVGAGAIANTFHLPAWQEVAQASLVAVCDIDDEAAKQASKTYHVKPYRSYDEMLAAEDLDIVDICTPNALHADQILRALEHGAHVIVEKPLVTRAADVEAIAKLADARGRKVMCAQHQRFRPATTTARSIISEGKLGDIYYARAQAIKRRGVPEHSRTFTDSTLSGGGPLMDLGAHVIDLAWWLMGCPTPLSAIGTVTTRLAGDRAIASANGDWATYDVEDFASARIQFENSAVLSIETSYLSHAHEDTVAVELFGEHGGLLWPEMILTLDDQGTCTHEKLEVTDQSLASVLELQHIVKCIVENKPTMIPIEESAAVVEMIEAIYTSSREDRVVEFQKRPRLSR